LDTHGGGGGGVGGGRGRGGGEMKYNAAANALHSTGVTLLDIMMQLQQHLY
jgi:hypothetical protein